MRGQILGRSEGASHILSCCVFQDNDDSSDGDGHDNDGDLRQGRRRRQRQEDAPPTPPPPACGSSHLAAARSHPRKRARSLADARVRTLPSRQAHVARLSLCLTFIDVAHAAAPVPTRTADEQEQRKDHRLWLTSLLLVILQRRTEARNATHTCARAERNRCRQRTPCGDPGVSLIRRVRRKRQQRHRGACSQ